MSVIPLSSSSLAGQADKMGAQNFQAHAQGNDFLALLTVSTGAVQGNSPNMLSDILTPETNTQPLVTQPKDTKATPDVQNATENAPRVQLPIPLVSNEKQPAPNNSPNNSTDINKQVSNPVKAKADDKTQEASGTSTDASEDADKKIRQAIQDKLGEVDQLLASIIQSLMGNVKPDGQTLTVGAANATTSIAITATITPGQGDGAAPIVNEQMVMLSVANQPAGAAATNNLSLLSDMQSLLQQMQQSLLGNAAQPLMSSDTQSAVSNTTPSTIPDSMVGNLQAAMDMLSKLSGGSDGTEKVASPLTQAATFPANPAPDPASLVQDGLDAIKSQLQKMLDSLAPAKPVAAKNDTASPLVEALLLPRDGTNKAPTPALAPAAPGAAGNEIPVTSADTALSATAIPDKTANIQPQVAVSEIAGLTAATPQQQAPVVNPTNNAQALIALPVTQTESSSGNADTNSGGNNEGQAPAQPIAAGLQPAQATKDTTSASFSRLLNPAAPSALLEQVNFQVKTGLRDGSSKITIQLHPNDLGKMDIKLSVDTEGKTSVVVTVENPKTLDMLQRDAQGLARALSDAGLKTDSGSLSFNLGGQQNFNQSAGQQAATQPALTYQKMQPDEAPETNLNILTRNYVVTVSDGVDIQI